MTATGPDGIPDALPPDLLEEGGLAVTVGFIRYAKGSEGGTVRTRVERAFLPLGGGQELETLRLEALAHLLASKIQLHLQAHGWTPPGGERRGPPTGPDRKIGGPS